MVATHTIIVKLVLSTRPTLTADSLRTLLLVLGEHSLARVLLVGELMRPLVRVIAHKSSRHVRLLTLQTIFVEAVALLHITPRANKSVDLNFAEIIFKIQLI